MIFFGIRTRTGSIVMGSSSPCRASNTTWGPVPLQAVGLTCFDEISGFHWFPLVSMGLGVAHSFMENLNLKWMTVDRIMVMKSSEITEQVLFHPRATRKRASEATLSSSGRGSAILYDLVLFKMGKTFVQERLSRRAKCCFKGRALPCPPFQICFRHVGCVFKLVCLRFQTLRTSLCDIRHSIQVFEQCLKIFEGFYIKTAVLR